MEHQQSKVERPTNQEGVHMLASKEFVESLIQSCPDGIIGINREGTIIIFNRAAETLIGLKASKILGKASITNVYSPPELARQIKKQLYSDGKGGVGCLDGMEIEVRGADGKTVPIRLSATLLFEKGKEIGSVGFFHDITERIRMEEELRKHAITDSLTGLLNRRQFHNMLSTEVDRSHRYDRPLTMAMFDLDHFKPFNDTYGHQEGDDILRLVSQTMKQNLRQQDQAFRLGGDEFAFILVETDLEQGKLAVERFRKSFNDAWPSKMSHLGTKLPPVTLSLGMAQLAERERADKLIKRADLAMYEAKRDGGDGLKVAKPEISENN